MSVYIKNIQVHIAHLRERTCIKVSRRSLGIVSHNADACVSSYCKSKGIELMTLEFAGKYANYIPNYLSRSWILSSIETAVRATNKVVRQIMYSMK